MTENIIISDLKDFEEKKKKIIKKGASNFHVISDFDRTLTKCFVDGKRISSLISWLRNGNYLTKDYSSKAHALFDEYHPIEINPNIPFEEKKEKMYEWWKKHFDLLIECGLDKDTIKKAVKDMIKENFLVLREGAKEFLKILKERNIPLVIMSASVGDMIIEFLKENNVYYDNIIVIANLLEYEGEKVIGVKEIIHVLNKKEVDVNLIKTKNRKNVLLLGDGLGDLGMIKGFDFDVLVSTGFLNENVDENLDSFKKNFDAVILDDGDFGFVNDFIKEI